MTIRILSAVILAVVTAQSINAQAPDRTKPPVVVEPGVADFSVRKLTGPVTIDRRNWIAAEPAVGASKPLRAPNGQFTLMFEGVNEPGDIVRSRLSFSAGGAPILLDPRVSYAYVTPNSRFVVIEPIDVVDVTTWRRYALSRAFNVTPFVLVRAISADGRRLYVTRQPCPFDCHDQPNEHYEITFPR